MRFVLTILLLAVLVASCKLDKPKNSLTVIEFGDFQCTACRRLALVHWPAVKAQFGDRVTLLYRHWPQRYHPHAYQAAVAAVCAGEQGHFSAIHDLFYREQALIGVVSFREFARRSGVPNVHAFDRCVAGPNAKAIVDTDIRAAEQSGGEGTPALLINGIRYRLRSDTTWLPRIIDSLLRGQPSDRDSAKPH